MQDLNGRINPSHSPEKIASSLKIRDVKISPDGRRILYQVQPFYHRGSDITTSELWLAETDSAHSARQLTNGDFNDRAGVWHPDGKRVFFLSDRHEAGKAGHIFVMTIGREGQIESEVAAFSKVFEERGVQRFEISRDGNFVAFIVAVDGKSRHRQQLKAEPKVFGAKADLARLKLFDFRTGIVSKVPSIFADKHVESFAWSPDSKELLCRSLENKGAEFAEMEMIIERVAISADEKDQQNATGAVVGKYPRTPSGPTIWLSSGHIVSTQSYEPSNVLDARTLTAHRFDGIENKLYGLTEDAVRVLDMGCGTQTSRNAMIAVEVCTDVDTRIDVVGFVDDRDGDIKVSSSLFETKGEEAIWFGAWDAKCFVSEENEASYVFAAVLSSGIHHRPPNVWSIRVQANAPQERRQLSSHLQWLADAPKIETEVIHWESTDGTKLSGLVRYLPGYNGLLPTILHIHGGPYRRDIPDYMPYFCNWREMLASAGYLVISPNYRGSQGRGHKFAHAAEAGIGVYDWDDCESMVDEVIKRGLADPRKLGVAGWSHGGSLTAWGVTKTKNRFKAAVVGAGAVDWEGMVLQSASPELEMAISGHDPWGSKRKSSPIHEVAAVDTAVLILHGEKDERVPVGQSVGFWRGLKRKATERGKKTAELIVYPREPHGFVERENAEDVMRRVLVHFNTHL